MRSGIFYHHSRLQKLFDISPAGEYFNAFTMSPAELDDSRKRVVFHQRFYDMSARVKREQTALLVCAALIGKGLRDGP